MPTYEYRCDNGHTFEVTQRMVDDPIEKCEVCGEPVQRVFHPVAVHFKGSGFYSTDYGKGRGGGAGGGDGASSSDDSSKSESSRSESSSKDDSGSKSGSGSDSKPADSKKSDSNKQSD